MVIFCTVLVTNCTRRDGSSGRGDLGAPEGERLVSLAAEEYAAELQFSPVTATWLGDHHLDDRLDDVRTESVNREIARLAAMRERVVRGVEAGAGDGAGQEEGGPDGAGPGDRGLDAALLLSRIDDRLYELKELRPFDRNPVYYMSLIAGGVDGLLTPDFVQVEARVRVMSRRLKAIPDFCHEAQQNLRSPPEIATRRAIELGQMTRDFLATLLPRLVRGVTDAKLREEFNHNNEEARKALEEFTGWMGRELLPHAKGEWVLGRERLLSRLRAAEMLDVGLEQVQASAERELRETRRRMEDVARRITAGTAGGPGAPRAAVAEASRLVEEDHARPEELKHEAETTLAELYQFVGERALLTLPATRAVVVDMPPYRWGYAWLSAPGPLETRTREAQFYVDPVDPGWTDKKKVADHLRMLNRAQIRLTAIHEVVPGHLVQMEAARRAGTQQGAVQPLSLVRQRVRSMAFIEGWAQYAEELMTEAEPDSERLDKLMLLAERSLLLRLGRLVVVLRLHAPPAGVPLGAGVAQGRLDDAVRFLMEDCYLDEYAARHEVDRATYDPLCGLPALGWLQLEKLRDDYREEQGRQFSLQAFHDAVLAQGELPVVALRRLLLADPGASL